MKSCCCCRYTHTHAHTQARNSTRTDSSSLSMSALLIGFARTRQNEGRGRQGPLLLKRYFHSITGCWLTQAAALSHLLLDSFKINGNFLGGFSVTDGDHKTSAIWYVYLTRITNKRGNRLVSDFGVQVKSLFTHGSPVSPRDKIAGVYPVI